MVNRGLWTRGGAGGGLLDQYLSIARWAAEGLKPWPCLGQKNPKVHALFNTLNFIEFLKQGPASKKEGPDPSKGSNQ